MNGSESSFSRRAFLRSAAVATAGASVPARALSAAQDRDLTVAGYRYGRVAALADRRVGIEGCRTLFEEDVIGELNTHAFSGPGTRDVTEVGLHPFMLAYANDGFRDYALLPIFLLRQFRHKSIFVRTDRGIASPADLRGKRVATPGYSSTSLTWIRGLLEDEYGVTPADIEWVVSAQDSSAETAGKVSAQENVFPSDLSVTVGPDGQDESDLIESGAVDALFHALEPRAYVKGHPDVARLFPNYKQVEREYYERTGIFPIMHAVAIRRDLVAELPWLPVAVCEAYSRAKSLSYNQMRRLGWATDMLPWYGNELEETRSLMGDNFYSYGVYPNRETLETLFRYSHRQQLAQRELSVDELFVPETLEWTERTD